MRRPPHHAQVPGPLDTFITKSVGSSGSLGDAVIEGNDFLTMLRIPSYSAAVLMQNQTARRISPHPQLFFSSTERPNGVGQKQATRFTTKLLPSARCLPRLYQG
jgi:hypothetical protein